MEPAVLSLGGSILAPPEGLDVDLARQVGDLLQRVASERTVFTVVGGGPPPPHNIVGARARGAGEATLDESGIAPPPHRGRLCLGRLGWGGGGPPPPRDYIAGARALGADEATLDDAGIAATRLNARFLLAALPGAHPVPARSHTEALVAARSSSLVVMGGTHAGHTTDAVGAMLAEKAGAGRLVVATNVDGVYTADPAKDPEAERLPELTHDELVEITSGAATSAGTSGVVDPMAARVLARSGIPAAIVDGKDLKALEEALAGGEDLPGSLVRSEEV